MAKNRKKIAAAVLAIAALGLVGCAASTEAKTGDGQVMSRTVTTSDGRSVECIFWVPVDSTGFATAEGAQMDCDWEGSR